MARQHLREWLMDLKSRLNMPYVQEEYQKFKRTWSENWFCTIRRCASEGDTSWFCKYNIPGWTHGTSWVIICIMIVEDLIDKIPPDSQ